MMRIVVTSLCLLGCADDAGLRVTIDADPNLTIGPQGDVDAVTVELVASQGPDPDQAFTCQAARWELPSGNGQLSFPVSVVVRPGDMAWHCVAVRVTGFAGGVRIIRAEDAMCPDLAEVTDMSIELSGRCHADKGGPECGDGQSCDSTLGDCVPSPAAAMFEAEPVLLRSCDSSSE